MLLYQEAAVRDAKDEHGQGRREYFLAACSRELDGVHLSLAGVSFFFDAIHLPVRSIPSGERPLRTSVAPSK